MPGAGARAEELRLQQFDGPRAAVDGQEFLVALGAGGVDGAGEEFLAGPRFADQQHVGIGDRDLADRLLQVGQDFARADDLVEIAATGQLAPQHLVFDVKLPVAVEPIELVGEVLEDHGLDEVIEGPGLEGLDGVLDRGVGGDDQHRRFEVHLLQPSQEREPVAVGKLHVADRDVEIALAGQLAARRPPWRRRRPSNPRPSEIRAASCG